MEALRELTAGLPEDLPVPVLVVLHVAATGSSVLASILDRASPMTCEPASDQLVLEPGHVYVAPPDCHLLVQDGRMRLDSGPRVNGHRPAVDPLFRSVADVFGDRGCAVVLSGTRDDGTAGLAAVKARGGTTVVQDPDDALYAGMPESAMAHVRVDAVLAATAMGPALEQLVRDGTFPSGTTDPDPSAMRDPATSMSALFVCPECGGRLVEEDHDGVNVLACHVGHVYSPESFVAEQADATERALWTAIRALEDRAELLRRMADRFNRQDTPRSAAQFARQAAEAEAQAQAVRATIDSFSLTLRRVPEEADEPQEGVA